MSLCLHNGWDRLVEVAFIEQGEFMAVEGPYENFKK